MSEDVSSSSEGALINVAGVDVPTPTIGKVGRKVGGWVWAVIGICFLAVVGYILRLNSEGMYVSDGPRYTYDYLKSGPSFRVIDSFRITNHGLADGVVHRCELVRIGLGEKPQPNTIFDRVAVGPFRSRDFGCVFDIGIEDAQNAKPWLLGIYAGGSTRQIGVHEFDIIRNKDGRLVLRPIRSSGETIKGPSVEDSLHVELVVNGAYGNLHLRQGDTFIYTWGGGAKATSCEFRSPGYASVSVSGSSEPIGPGHPYYPKVGVPTLLVIWCTNGFENASARAVVDLAG